MLSAGTKVIAIGASTGGVDALEHILPRFSVTTPPILLVLHMPPGITKLYASQLDAELKISVKEAETGDLLRPGQLLLAPSGKHMTVVKGPKGLSVKCLAGEKVQHVIPSADVLFESVAKELGKNAVGVILTGIGADGARGLLQMRESGAQTIGQDEETSAVYGMSKVAKTMGSVCYELPLNQIAGRILSLAR